MFCFLLSTVLPLADAGTRYFGAFNGDCLQQVVNLSDSLPYVAGSLVWTLGDYIGERESPLRINATDAAGATHTLIPLSRSHAFTHLLTLAQEPLYVLAQR
jgi:hypothetical protein